MNTLAGSGAMEALPLDDTASVRLVLSSVRYNSSSGEHGVSFHDYAGECIMSLHIKMLGNAIHIFHSEKIHWKFTLPLLYIYIYNLFLHVIFFACMYIGLNY